MARIFDEYKSEVIPKLKERFGYTNPHQIPRLEKVVLNAGVGETTQNSKAIDGAIADLAAISGQKPVTRRARKSIANFKLREGQPIGASVTLRGERMYEFVDRFISIALPRMRDFRGIPKNAFDGRGNYSYGITEQIVFPEIDIEKTTVRGFGITFVTSAKSDDEGRALLEYLGFPFRN